MNTSLNQTDRKGEKKSLRCDKILFVDDEQNILDGIRRQLRNKFNVDTALGPEEGLKRFDSNMEYAVVVSDMRMPGMDGISFLNQVKQRSAFTVRMMLTGNSDQQTATDALNKGNIFRFMNKPCTTDTLVSNLEAALEQFKLITAEKELLEQTLNGSISVLVDILALTNPIAFSRAERIKFYATRSAQLMKRTDIWKFEVAAMLSQIGYVTIPTDIMEKYFVGEELTESEQTMLSEHSKTACQMIDKIPRLEEVAKMISLKDSVGNEDPEGDVTILGGQLLRAVSEFEKQLSRGSRPYQALHAMKESEIPYSDTIMTLLADIQPPMIEKTVNLIEIRDLRIGMTLAEDIRGNSNMLIVSKGQVVNELMHVRLENFLQQKAIGSKVRVYEIRNVFTAENEGGLV